MMPWLRLSGVLCPPTRNVLLHPNPCLLRMAVI
jgi:hypothetical protein